MPRCVECLRLLCFRRPANLPVIKTDAGMSLFRAIARRDGRILHRRLILNHSRSLWKRGAGRVWRCNG